VGEGSPRAVLEVLPPLVSFVVFVLCVFLPLLYTSVYTHAHMHAQYCMFVCVRVGEGGRWEGRAGG